MAAFCRIPGTEISEKSILCAYGHEYTRVFSRRDVTPDGLEEANLPTLPDGNRAARFGNHLDLEQLRPQLAGDEQAAAGRVPRDSVENGFRAGVFARRKQALEIDPAQDPAGAGRNTRDPVGVPDVGVHLTLDVLEFVEIRHRLAVVLDGQAADLLERKRIEESQGRRAIAENERLAVLGKAPSFSGVREGVQQAECESVIDQGYVGLPGELDQGASPGGEAFAKVLWIDGLVLKDAAGFEVDHAQRGLAVDPGAFVEVAVDEDQALGKSAGV